MNHPGCAVQDSVKCTRRKEVWYNDHLQPFQKGLNRRGAFD